jgi:hypothetical protein
MATNQNTQTDQVPKENTVQNVPNGAGRERGRSGTLIYSGQIINEEYNQLLVGKRGIKEYEIMRKSEAAVQEMLKVIKHPLLAVQWKIDTAKDTDFDNEVSAFVSRELFDRNINFKDTMRQGLSCMEFGWSLFEKVHELTQYNGKTRVGLKKMGFRKQLSIEKWETLDKKPGVTQQLPGTIVDIPRDKLVIFTNEKEGDNYEGVSVLRAAYKDYDIRNKLIIANAVSLEKLGGGVPVLTPPTSPDPKDVIKAREALKRMRVNEEAYIELPQGWAVEMLDMKSNSVKDMLPTIKYHETMMKKSILASFLDIATNSTGGSRAVSQDHSQLFEKALEAIAQIIADTFNEQVIKPLCDFNFTTLPNGYPKLTFSNIGDEDLSTMGEYFNKLASVDMITPDPDIEDYLRSLARAPKLPQDIRDNYEDRQLNKNSITRTTLAPELETRKGDQPGAKPTATPTTSKGTKDLPTDPSNKPATKKAEAVAAANDATRQLVDVILR